MAKKDLYTLWKRYCISLYICILYLYCISVFVYCISEYNIYNIESLSENVNF